MGRSGAADSDCDEDGGSARLSVEVRHVNRGWEKRELGRSIPAIARSPSADYIASSLGGLSSRLCAPAGSTKIPLITAFKPVGVTLIFTWPFTFQTRYCPPENWLIA